MPFHFYFFVYFGFIYPLCGPSSLSVTPTSAVCCLIILFTIIIYFVFPIVICMFSLFKASFIAFRLNCKSLSFSATITQSSRRLCTLFVDVELKVVIFYNFNYLESYMRSGNKVCKRTAIQFVIPLPPWHHYCGQNP